MTTPRKNFWLKRQSGIALVVVLAFVVLLTTLVIAYFSRSMTDRQISNSSFNQFKADDLAKSALNIITGDLKQEIAIGSNPLPNPNPNNYPLVYAPLSGTYMAPLRNGIPVTSGTTLATVLSGTPLSQTGTYPLGSTLIRVSSTNAVTISGSVRQRAQHHHDQMEPALPDAASDRHAD